MNSCRVCLVEEQLESCIDIFNQSINIASILSKHFWFEVTREDKLSKYICTKCWDSVKTFHTFYKQIEKIHTQKYVSVQLTDIFERNCSEKNSTVFTSENKLFIKVEEDATTTKIETESENEEDSKNNIFLDTYYEIDGSIKNESEDSTPELREEKNCTDKETKKSSIGAKKILNKSKNKKKIGKEIKQKQHVEDDNKIAEFYKMECDKCNAKCFSFAEIQAHMRKVHGITRAYLICCNRKFFRRGLLLEHIDFHRNPAVFKCSKCQKNFPDMRGLTVHMHTHISSEDRLFKCDICGRSYSFKPKLLKHIRLAHMKEEEKLHKCEECGKAFAAKSILQSHVRGVHQNCYVHVCDICAKIFKSKAQYMLHRADHSDKPVAKVQCLKCGSWFKNKYRMEFHMRRLHVDQTPQECSHCGKLYPNKDALRVHIKRVHIDQRIHKCTICEKAFKQPIILKEHMASHTDTVLYMCTYCPKTFNSNSNRHAHRKRVHPEEWLRDRLRKGLAVS